MFLRWIFICVAKNNGVSGFAGHVLNASHKQGEKVARYVGDNDTKGPCLLYFERPRDIIGLVVQIPGSP